MKAWTFLLLLALLGPQGAGVCHLLKAGDHPVAGDHREGHADEETSWACAEDTVLLTNRAGVGPAPKPVVQVDGTDAGPVGALLSLFRSPTEARHKMPVSREPGLRSATSPVLLSRFLL